MHVVVVFSFARRWIYFILAISQQFCRCVSLPHFLMIERLIGGFGFIIFPRMRCAVCTSKFVEFVVFWDITFSKNFMPSLWIPKNQSLSLWIFTPMRLCAIDIVIFHRFCCIWVVDFYFGRHMEFQDYYSNFFFFDFSMKACAKWFLIVWMYF